MKEDYDNEPVVYCAKCYSLNIQHEDGVEIDCCGNCGCTDIEETSIWNWEAMYKHRYGKRFIDGTKNPRLSMFYNVSIDELKKIVFKHERFKYILKRMYPRFPGGLTREESVIVLFDQLGKENRLDELRNLLFRMVRSERENERINNKNLIENGREENDCCEERQGEQGAEAELRTTERGVSAAVSAEPTDGEGSEGAEHD